MTEQSLNPDFFTQSGAAFSTVPQPRLNTDYIPFSSQIRENRLKGRRRQHSSTMSKTPHSLAAKPLFPQPEHCEKRSTNTGPHLCKNRPKIRVCRCGLRQSKMKFCYWGGGG